MITLPNKQFIDLELWNSDFFNNTLEKESVDLVLTDPPYNISDKGTVTTAGNKIYSNNINWGDTFKDSFTKEEYKEFTEKYLKACLDLLKPGCAAVVFTDRRFVGQLAEIAERIGFIYKNLICFVKVNCVPKIRAFNYASAIEVAVWLHKPRNKGTKTKPEIFNYQKPTKNVRHSDGQLNVVEYHNTYSSNVFFYNIGRKIFGHPTEKYGGQLIPLIQTHSNERSVILDPFGGSFAVGYYAAQLNRSYIGFELSSEFFNDSIRKLEELYGTKSKKAKKGSSKTTKGGRTRARRAGAKKATNTEVQVDSTKDKEPGKVFRTFKK